MGTVSKRGRRQQMWDANALCPRCRSHDVSFALEAGHDGRPVFICGSCRNSWTSGCAGYPYSQFARGVPPPPVVPHRSGGCHSEAV